MTKTDPIVRTDWLQPGPPAALKARLKSGDATEWSVPVTFRTYVPEDPVDVPVYLNHHVHQGSGGRVYPLPFIERISGEAEDREWQAVHLENRHLRLLILPELGGLIHFGHDEVTGHGFFYRDTVIKPALMGLTGPWVSGRVEFSWPQHHRPGTYQPVETYIDQYDDGRVTVGCGDHEPFQRRARTHGVRLHRNRSVVEAAVRLHSRTALSQTFLWWAKAAVRVHDDQSFFPHDVRYVANHGPPGSHGIPCHRRTIPRRRLSSASTGTAGC